jgi:ABC-type Fe3+/spermidine/putrescine transport system ATPase subunit
MAHEGHRIRLERLVKRFGVRVAVDHVDLAVRRAEFLTLLGPSGCGKTTTLRMVAGFVVPDSGRVWLDGTDVTGVPPNRRNIGMVYQQYALFPHLSVFDNVGFGLRLRGLSRRELGQRVEAMIALVRLEGLEDRLPSTLSGGQQQRVALARALVIQPNVLLLDEPLSNLDAKLRREMQLEIRRLQRELQITTIHVTHDQDEALAMSDRVAVMHRGRIEQVDTPMAIYRTPLTAFVAGFIGQANLFEGVVEASEEGAALRMGGWRLSLGTRRAAVIDGPVLAVVRPEAVMLSAVPVQGAQNGRIADRIFGGSSVQYRVGLPGGLALLVEQTTGPAGSVFEVDTPVWVQVPAEAVVLLAAPLGPSNNEFLKRDGESRSVTESLR